MKSIFFLNYICVRTSHWRFAIKKGVLKNFAKSTWIICAKVSFLIKLQTSASNFITKEALAQVFSCEFREIYNKIIKLIKLNLNVFKVYTHKSRKTSISITLMSLLLILNIYNTKYRSLIQCFNVRPWACVFLLGFSK